MNVATIDKKIRESTPFKWIVIAGIVLAMITFFILLSLIGRLLFGFGKYAFNGFNAGFAINASSTPASAYLGDPRTRGRSLVPQVPNYQEIKEGRYHDVQPEIIY